MNEQLQLQLQAWLDDELPEHEAREMERHLEKDASARALVAELRATKNVLRANEPEYRMEESWKFYWSKIEREIRRLEEQPTPVAGREAVGGMAPWLRRLVAPLAGAALVALAVFSVLQSRQTGDRDSYLAEVENNTAAMTAFSFRAESENMFVVWISDRYEGPLIRTASTD